MSDIVLDKVTLTPSSISSGESAMSIDQTSGELQITDGDTGETTAVRSVFGRDYFYGANTTEQTNDTDTFDTYLNFNYTGVSDNPNARYRIGFSFCWGYSNSQRDYVGQILINGNVLVQPFQKEPKDPGGDQRPWDSIFFIIDPSVLGPSGTIQFQFKATQAGDVATTHFAHMELYRIQ